MEDQDNQFYAEIHGLPRNVNRITQPLTLFPAETSYKSVYRDIAGFENDSMLKLLKYDAFRKLWHQLTPYIQERTYVIRVNGFGMLIVQF